MSRKRSSPIRQLLSPGRIFIPIGIGLAIVAYIVFRDYNAQKEVLSSITWSWKSTLWFAIALLMVVLRDVGYMSRIRILTDNQLTWRRSFDVIMLWEFASAISPSIVGGSGVAIFIVNKEGITLGRSTAVVMITAFLDELFYVLMVPLLIIIVGWDDLFPVALEKSFFGITLGVREIFIVGYGFILGLITMIYLAIFRFPKTFKNVLTRIFSIRLLKRWQEDAISTGDDIITSSVEFNGKPRRFWLKAFTATFLSWTARFWVVNFLILSFTLADISLFDHFLIYARQLVMWVILLISPTPGGAGIAEVAFNGFLKSFVVPGGLALSLAVLWRFLTYYPYLLMGAIILPRWLQRVYLKRKLIRFRSPD